MPPSPEMLRPAPTHVPLTPMMDFFQRRLEALEKELSVERERARAAQGLIEQQAVLRGEVDTQLKALTDQLKREKAEREGEEEKSHARGRIDALEKRLDEMHQAWVSLLKDAVKDRQAGEQVQTQELSALRTELAAVSENLKSLSAQTANLSSIVPELRAVAGALPAEGQHLEDRVSQVLNQISESLRSQAASWERRAALEGERQQERLKALTEERSALLKAYEEQNHRVRHEFLQESLRREGELGAQISEILRGVSETKQRQDFIARQWEEVQAGLAKVIERLLATPQAKDQALADLEGERQELLRSLQERSQTLSRYLAEKRQIETTMGESLLGLQRQLEAERAKALEAPQRVGALEGETASLKEELAAARRTAAEREERCRRLASERDEMAKTLIAEAGKVRGQIEERLRLQEEFDAKVRDVLKSLAAETAGRAKEAAAVSELRGQMSAMAEQLTKALREKDDVLARFSNWEKERERLLTTLRQKDEMISMLSATFQNLLQKPG